MKREELEPLCAAALAIAREAGDLVRAGFRKRVAVEHKRSKTDLVTEYDRASEAFVRTRLAAVSPHAIIGEEEGGTWDSSVPTFFLDPIDGTTNFVHGHPFWCVSIGLVADRQPVLGVVVAPALALAWSGFVADDGTRVAMREAEPCAPSTTSRVEDAYLATGFPYDRNSDPENNFLEFTSIKRKCQAVRRCGSAALDLCLVADGTYDGYWEQKLNPWDIAGGCAIVRAAGGGLSDYEGGSSFLATGRLVATNGALHAALLAELIEVRRGRTS